MGSLSNPKTWVPNINTKDCSQGFCSLYCPQWCYIIFPPPPPLVFIDDNSGPNFSPLVIAIIGILASAFLLVSYYAIISKYCGNRNSTRRENHDTNVQLEEDHDHSNHDPWHVANNGLDEALIKNITLLKYKKGDGLIDGTDCSVCLGEFQEDESLRLLPKCSHAFHVTCIDTWLKSHSNCPLCRAAIVNIYAPPVPMLPPVSGPFTNSGPSSHQENNNLALQEDTSDAAAAEIVQGEVITKAPERAFSDLGNSKSDTVIEIREDDEVQQIRRSVSMDFVSQGHLSKANILHITQR